VASVGYVAHERWLAERQQERVEQAKVEELERARLEKEIYQSLDRRDASAAGASAENLRHEDERVRLAALRLVASLDPEPHEEALVALFDDPSPRVRRASLQLGSRLPNAATRLVEVAAGEDRDLAERLLALAAVTEQGPRAREVAPALVALLGSGSPVIQAKCARALLAVTGERPGTEDPANVRRFWTEWLARQGGR
jgi:hypothetical protein